MLPLPTFFHVVASLRSTSTKNGLKRISRMFFKTINNFNSYSSKQRSMFAVLQGVSSSLEQADSEFPHVTDCTGQVRCGPLETRCRFQWDVEKKELIPYPSMGTFFKGKKIPEMGLTGDFQVLPLTVLHFLISRHSTARQASSKP